MQVFLFCAVCINTENEKIVWLTGDSGMRILKPHQNHRRCIRMQFLLSAMDISNFRGRFSTQDSSFDE